MNLNTVLIIIRLSLIHLLLISLSTFAEDFPEDALVLCNSGRHPNSCYLVGKYLEKHGKFEEAGLYYEKGCDKNDQLNCDLLARWAQKKGNIELAVVTYEKICGLVQRSWKKRFCDKAKILSLGPEKACEEGDAKTCLDAATYAKTLNDEKLAIKLFDISCKLGEIDACYSSAKLSGDQRSIIAVLKKKCQVDPYYACVELAEYELKANNTELAIQWLDKSCKKTNAQACLRQSQLYMRQKSYDAAKQSLKLACGKPWTLAYACGLLKYLRHDDFNEEKIREVIIMNCQNNIGEDCYYQSHMSTYNNRVEESERLLFKSCEIGFGLACYKIAANRLLELSKEEQEHYYELGCKNKHGDSCLKLSHMRPYDKDLNRKACEYGALNACGIYVHELIERDYEKGKRLLISLCQTGVSQACRIQLRRSLDRYDYDLGVNLYNQICSKNINEVNKKSCDYFKGVVNDIIEAKDGYHKVLGSCKKVKKIREAYVEKDIPEQEYYDFEVSEHYGSVQASSRRCSKKEEADAVHYVNQENKKKAVSNSGVVYEEYACTVLEQPQFKNDLLILEVLDRNPKEPQVSGKRLLSFITYNKAGQKYKMLDQITSVSSEIDLKRDAKIKKICDIDGDDMVEIIIDNILYAGMNKLVYSFSQEYTKFSVEKTQGYSWD